MKFNNPIHNTIFEKVLQPVLENRKGSVPGYIDRISDDFKEADISVNIYDAGFERYYKNVSMPEGNVGVYGNPATVGDKVTLGFYDGDLSRPYVSHVYQKIIKQSLDTKKGAKIPSGNNFF